MVDKECVMWESVGSGHSQVMASNISLLKSYNWIIQTNYHSAWEPPRYKCQRDAFSLSMSMSIVVYPFKLTHIKVMILIIIYWE